MGRTSEHIRSALPSLVSVAISLVGVAAFMVLNLPLPWLLGPLFACLVAALAGAPLKGMPRVSNSLRTVLGVAVGASITPALVYRIPDFLGSLVFVVLIVLFAAAVGTPYFRKVWGYDGATSYFAAMPGGLQDMLIFGEEAGGNPRVLSLVHATRVLLIVTGLPLIFVYFFGIVLSSSPGQPAADLPAHEMALMVVLALGGWWAARAVGLFGASILGPLFATAAASLLGLLEHRPPSEAIIAAQFFIGYGVGVKYVGITGEEIRKVVFAGAVYTLLLSAFAAGLGLIAVELGLAPVRDISLAYAPGGQAELAVLAILAHGDLSFVIAHHVFRIVMVITGAPIMRRFFS